jgi:hypothetical protein
MHDDKKLERATSLIQEALRVANGISKTPCLFLSCNIDELRVGGILSWQWLGLTQKEHDLLTELLNVMGERANKNNSEWEPKTEADHGGENGHS